MTAKTEYRYAWRSAKGWSALAAKRASLFGRRFTVLARGKMNSALVQFLDNGQLEVISRNAIRKV